MEFRIDKFLGLGTRWGRNIRPLGFWDDSRNLVLNAKSGKPAKRTGYATDTSQPYTDASGLTALTTINKHFYTATEVPEAKDIKVIAGSTAGGAKHFFQKGFYHGSATITDSFLDWGESLALTGVSLGTNNMFATNAGQSTDYYKGWTIRNSTRSESVYVTAYSSGTNQFNVLPDIPSGWQAGDTYVAYRHFHDNPGFAPSWTEPTAIKQGNGILASGGQSSDVGCKLIHSLYLNKTFFSGANQIAFQETYVSEAEVKSTNGIRPITFNSVANAIKTGAWSASSIGVDQFIQFTSGTINASYVGGTFVGTDSASSPVSATITSFTPSSGKFQIATHVTDGAGIGDGTATAPNASAMDQGYYSFGYSLETDDGQRGPLIRSSLVNIPSAGGYQISSTVIVDPALLNKTIRYINLFVGKSTSAPPSEPDWSSYFQFRALDLTDTNWSLTATSGATIGFYSQVIYFSNGDWSSADGRSGGDAVSFLGYSEPNTTTVSCSRMMIQGGRLFVAKYYDYTAALNYNDAIRYSTFGGNGVPMYNVLPDIGGFTESTIEAGDPNVISNFAREEDFLFIAKTRGIYRIPITADPETWILVPISKEVGCDAPLSMAETPYGICWAKSGDDVYIWRGGKQESLAENFLTDFRALSGTYASQWVGWYDPQNKSYRLMITTDGSTLTNVYEFFFEVKVPTPSGREIPAVVKHVLANGVSGVTKKSDGTVYFNTTTATFYFSSSATDGSTAIDPYLYVSSIVLDEKNLVAVTKLSIANEQSGTPTGSLNIKLYADGTSYKTLSTVTQTSKFWQTRVPQTLGRKIGLEFIQNSSSTGWTTFQINEIAFEYEVRPILGDQQTSL